METILLRGGSPEDIARAGEILRSGGLAAIPTETVYGLAANALDPDAVSRIFAAKGRPADNPLIVHICGLSQLEPLVQEVPEAAKRLAEAFWPGPLTIILKKTDLVPSITTGGLDTVAVRFPSHPVARAVIAAAGVPLAAPSANPSGRPSPTAFSHVLTDLNGRVDALVDGGDCEVGVESTVLTLADGRPRLLRPGGVTPGQLRAVLGDLEIDPAVLHRLEEGRRAASPGMKYRHYAPRARVVMVEASPEGYKNYVNQMAGENSCALCFEEDLPGLAVPRLSYGARWDGAAQAHSLFSRLYELDGMGAGTIYAHAPSRRGVGLAVYNRLIRAAGFTVVAPERPLLVGLTGPTGAGKSTVGGLLRRGGWAVIDCDALTHSPQVYSESCLEQLQAAFGEDILSEGVLNRALLARRAFENAAAKQRLEEIVFPHILKALELAVAEAARSHAVVALDAPTLFEAGLDRRCCRILAVTAPEETRLRRILERDGVTEEAARQRMAAQPPESFYTGRADWVVENPGGQPPSVEEPLRETAELLNMGKEREL